ncbi:MAG: radical SAM protein [Deltaproteobacteria bacterium]
MIVVWRVTEKCNLCCRFCACDRDLQKPRLDADPGEILRFGAVLAEYSRTSGDPILVSWLGGEPLIWPSLFELSEIFYNRYNIRLSTTTNGSTLASAAVRSHLLKYFSELTVSVDAVGKAHDDLRGWPGGYEYLKLNIPRLAAEKKRAGHGLVLRTNVLLMSETFPCFEQLCNELAAWGMEEVTFNQLGGNDRPEFYPDHRLSPEQADMLAGKFLYLHDHLSGRGLRLKGSRDYLVRIQASARNISIPVKECHPGQNFLFIDERGTVAPCSHATVECGIPIRSIRTTGDVRKLGAIFTDRRRQRNPQACGNCLGNHVFKKFREEFYETAGTGFGNAYPAVNGNAG